MELRDEIANHLEINFKLMTIDDGYLIADQILVLLAPVIESARKWDEVVEMENSCLKCPAKKDPYCFSKGGCYPEIIINALAGKEAI